MGRITLVTGGSRSGKSDHALELGEAFAGPRLFIATATVTDDEMAMRIDRHRRNRDPNLWDTIESPLDLPDAVSSARNYRVILIDCLTLWISNLMYAAHERGAELTEDDLPVRCEELLAACEAATGDIIAVTNEVGMGTVPDHPTSRLYRDLVGRCNRLVARRADTVVLVSCGIPLTLKSEGVS